MEPHKMAPLLHWGTYGIIKGLNFLDPLGGWDCKSQLVQDGQNLWPSHDRLDPKPRNEFPLLPVKLEPETPQALCIHINIYIYVHTYIYICIYPSIIPI